MPLVRILPLADFYYKLCYGTVKQTEVKVEFKMYLNFRMSYYWFARICCSIWPFTQINSPSVTNLLVWDERPSKNTIVQNPQTSSNIQFKCLNHKCFKCPVRPLMDPTKVIFAVIDIHALNPACILMPFYTYLHVDEPVLITKAWMRDLNYKGGIS